MISDIDKGFSGSIPNLYEKDPVSKALAIGIAIAATNLFCITVELCR